MKNISKGFFLGSFFFVGCPLILFLANFSLENGRLSILHMIIIYLLIVYLLLINLIFWFKAWRNLQDSNSIISPTKMVLFLLIPVYNLYWLFRVTWGYSKEFNSYLKKNNIPTLRLSEPLFLSYCISTIFTICSSFILKNIPPFLYIVSFCLQLEVINKVCDSIENLFQYKNVKDNKITESKSVMIRSYPDIFSTKQFGINYYIGIAYFFLAILSGFLFKYIFWLPEGNGIKIFLNFSFYNIFLVLIASTVFSTIFLISSHKIKFGWILAPVFGLIISFSKIFFTWETSDSVTYKYFFKLFIIGVTFIWALNIMVSLFEFKFWRFSIGVGIIFTFFELASHLPRVIVIFEENISFRNIFWFNWPNHLKALVYGLLAGSFFYLSITYYLKKQGYSIRNFKIVKF